MSSSSSSNGQLSKANIKNPIELQLWYDFVRKSCGTLSEIVFENFDAQVTKIIEDLVSSNDSDESTYYLDLLLCSKNRLSNKSLIRSKECSETISTSNNNNNSMESSMLSSSNICNQSSNISSSIDNKDETNDDLTKILKLINLDKDEQIPKNNESNESTMNDENNDDDDERCGKNAEKNENDEQILQQQQHSTPFIPLLTALGFDTTDFDQSIIDQ